MPDNNNEHPTPASPALRPEQYVLYGIVLITLAFVAYMRVRLLGLPLERDEGEYAYMGQSILNGVLPYVEAYNMKLPGVYYMYALFMAFFGRSVEGIHLGLLLINLVSAGLLFFIGKRMVSPAAGAVAGAAYVVLSLAPGTYGFAAHATHFIVLFSLGGFWALLRALDTPSVKWLAWSGALFGLSFLMKQHAVFLMIFGGVALLVQAFRYDGADWKTAGKRAGIYAAFAVLPYLIAVLIAVLSGSFDHFWFWTVEYAGAYVGIKTWSEALRQFRMSFDFVSLNAELLWVSGLLGLVALFFSSVNARYRLLLLLFTFFAFLCLFPGLYFRNHYFIVFLPAVSLLIGVLIQFLDERLARLRFPVVRYAGPVLAGGLMWVSLSAERKLYLGSTTAEVCSQMYGRNPFAEVKEVSRFLADNTTPADRIAVIGSEPQIYFYSNRKSASGFIYVYSLMESQRYSMQMQQEMIAEIEKNKPRYIVFVDSPFSWLVTAESNQYVIQWFDQYTSNNYNLVGFADMIAPGNTVYVWRNALNTYNVQGQGSISVFERKQ